MAGHSKFKNIMHRKNAQDAKRGKIFTKLIREITVAARNSADPEFNPRLRAAIIAAREANLPKDKIENAIKKGSSAGEGDNYEEFRYECYASGGVALIIDVLSDNKNRAASEIKTIINKAGATMAEPGSVLFMFDRVGHFVFTGLSITEEDVLNIALEAGADDCITEDNSAIIYTLPEKFHEAREVLEQKFGKAIEAKLIWKPKIEIEINTLAEAEKINHLIENLEDNDDVQEVSGNFVINL
jgi:YebC/PmpR family DNA-binding regulatory protein